ncbi:signal-transduction histidine kinase senX3 [Geobacter sp. OR-1]|uniref:PAS domain-containing sensor histidine kinase n=1 Tax=Geobacter sp. OR-1 TaxID=1266765 RepID=UPI000543B2DF|nr:PAS domain S-box protein [Geobacter sp. OR-1]GAM10098.1 signal-transduction histidine kinase senX3 [Geobacter sp. OR-1]
MTEHRRKTDSDVMFRDITVLMDLMPVGVRWLNRQGICEYVNRTFVEMFGYSLEEISSLNDWFIRAYPDPAYRNEVMGWYSDKIPRLVRGTIPSPLTAKITCKDGTIKHVIISAHIALGRIIGIYTDITEHAKTTELQLEIEKMFRLTFEGARDAIFWVNTESGILVNCNQAAEEMVEAPRNEIIGRHFTMLHPPDITDKITALFEKVTTAPDPKEDIEAEILSRSGRRLPVLIRTSITQIGETSIVQGIFLDISERKSAEKALVDSCTLLQKTLSSLNESVFIVDTATRVILDCNVTVESMFGYARNEIIGRHTSILHVSEEMSRIFGEEMRKGYREKGLFETEFKMRRKDGTSFNSDHCVMPICDENGTYVSHVCVVRDISLRKRAEDAIRMSEARYRAMVDAFDGFIYICSQERRIEFMNKRMIERTGYDATGELCHKALHDLETVCPWCVNERVFRGETVQWELQSPKDGRWYYISNTPIRNTAGIMSKQAMITDITVRKQAEQDRAALEAQRMMNDEQRQFLGLVSHEIRTPLAVIDGAAQLIHMNAPRESSSFTQAERIRGATVRLSNLIDSCLTDERLSAGGWLPDMRMHEIAKIMASAAEQAQAATRIHIIAFEHSGLPDRFNCDAMLIKVMLGNLLDNAVKYSPDGGKISLRGTGLPGGGVCMEVSDTGIGIPADQQERIFKRFYRTWQVSGVVGAGLGLHLVKKIAEIHGGTVTCTSTLGSGSKFSVTLAPTV